MQNSRGKIFFFSGPSGVGKGTLINHLRSKYSDFVFPPSCTTRSPRKEDKEGETYFFVSKEDFLRKIENDDFLEYAIVHGKEYYGTLKEKILTPIASGKIVIREFDVQGFMQARKILDRDDYVSIFIRPEGDEKSLITHIQKREALSEEELNRRVKSMREEIKRADLYDYQIYSRENKLETLFLDAEEIIAKETRYLLTDTE